MDASIADNAFTAASRGRHSRGGAVHGLGHRTAGPLSQLMFATITPYCSFLLCDCYRIPGPVEGKRNYTYTQTVRAFLGEILLVWTQSLDSTACHICIWKCFQCKYLG